MAFLDQKKIVPLIDEGRVEVVTSVSDLSRRMRLLEERHTGLRKNVQVVEQNHLGDSKRFFTEVKTINTELSELHHELSEVKEELRLVITELRECAKREQVMVLEKYINLWEPVNFVTRHEVERIVEQSVERLLNDKLEKE